MSHLDERTRAALLAREDPPPGAQDRVFAAILASGPPGGGGGEGQGPTPSGSGGFELGFVAKVVGATIGLTSVGLVSLALVGAGVRAIDRPSRPAAEARAGSAPAHARAHEPTPVEHPALEPGREAAIRQTPSTAPEPALGKPSKPGAGSSTATASAPAGDELGLDQDLERELDHDLERELALMQQARDASSATARLALLDRHAREFASGVLADEREVLRVETLCALGRVDEAESLAAKFVQAKPSNPLRSRVEPACAR